MPPVFGPGVAVAQALVVLRRGERQRRACRRPSTMKLASSPSRNSSMTTWSPAAPKRPANMASAVCDGFVGASADDHALAGGEAAGLDHDAARAARAPTSASKVVAREGRVGGGRNAVALEEFLGEGLGAFELRGRACAGRSSAGPRRRRRRRRRAPADLRARRCVSSTSRPRRSASRPAMSSAATSTLRTLGSRAVPALPGATSTSRHARRLRALPGQRVLAAAAPMIRTFMGRLSAGSAACR